MTPLRPRKITAEEKAWLIRGLRSLKTGEYAGCHAIDLGTGKNPPLGKPIDPRPFLDQLDSLIAVAECSCGQRNCHTVTFRQSTTAPRRTIVYSKTDDGRSLIIDKNSATGELAGLEIIQE